MLPIALKAVQLQLQAMGAGRYELGVRIPPEKSEDGKSQMILRNSLTNGEVFEKLDWLASENAKGHHIYIRPSGLSQLTLIDDLNRKSLDTLIDTGYTPACVVETSPGNFQAWLKHSWTLTAQEGTVAAKILAERFGGDPNSADWRHFGRLAGFTNPKPQYRLQNGLYPYSQLKFSLSKGVIYERTHEVLSEVEDRLLDQYMESQRSIQTRIGYQKHPQPESELLDYAHFANKYAAHGERHKADLTYAMRAGKVSVNPARLIRRSKESLGRVRFLSYEEEAKLRKVIALNLPGRINDEGESAFAQLDVALHTGMRKSEQFTATWEQVDLEKGYIYLSVTKNGSDRFVTLNSAAVQVLKSLQKRHKLLGLPSDSTLFHSKRDGLIKNPRKWFATALEQAKIKGVTWHTLRHTFASRLVMAGVDLKTVQELMGHKTIAMTARYAHLAPTHKLQALETLVRPGSVSVQSGHFLATSTKKSHKAKKVDILQLVESN